MSVSSDGTTPHSPEIPEDHLRERVVADIAPFFQSEPSADQTQARDAARQMLIGYETGSGRELQLAAQTVAFGMAALNCLSCSMSERDIPMDALLRMQGNAIALNKMADKSRKALDAWQRDRQRGQAATPVSADLNEVEFQTLIGKARKMVAFGHAQLEAHRISKALPVPSALPPVLLAEQPVSPELIARRKEAERVWAKDLDGLQNQTRH